MSHRENSLGLPIGTLSAMSRQDLVQGQSLLLSPGNGWAHLLFVPLSHTTFTRHLLSAKNYERGVLVHTCNHNIYTSKAGAERLPWVWGQSQLHQEPGKKTIWYVHYYTYLYHLPPILFCFFFQNSQSKLYPLMKFSAKHLYKSLHSKPGGGGSTRL